MLFLQELLDTLSKRLKEKSLVYSQQEFKDITDIVKVPKCNIRICFPLLLLEEEFYTYLLVFLLGSYKRYDDVFVKEIGRYLCSFSFLLQSVYWSPQIIISVWSVHFLIFLVLFFLL